MKINRIMLPALAFLLLLSGCVTHHPQTAEEFRKAVPGAFLAEVQSYEVDRPFRKVAASFKARAPKCLDVRIKTVSQSTTSYQVIVTKYNPTVVVTDQRAELHLQQHHEQGVMNVTEEPEGGYYLLVVDAIPVSKNKTHIDIYGPSVGHDTLIKAIKGWADGTTRGCPDLTK